MNRQELWVREKSWGKFREAILELNVKIKKVLRFKGEIKNKSIEEVINNWNKTEFNENEIKKLQDEIDDLRKRGSFRNLSNFKRINLEIPYELNKSFRKKILNTIERDPDEKTFVICFNSALLLWLSESEEKRIARFIKKLKEEK